MTVFSSSLELAGDDADADRFADAVYGDGHDCTISKRAGIVRAGFDREAMNLREAILSAIATIHRASPTVVVTGVSLDDGQPIDHVIAASA